MLSFFILGVNNNPNFFLIIQFGSKLQDAFVQNNINTVVMTVIDEKYSVTLADRLDEVVTTASFALSLMKGFLKKYMYYKTYNFVTIYNILHFKYRNLLFYADDILNKLQELRKNEHKNVALILRAIEHVISKDEECIHKLVHHGLVVKISIQFYRN